MAELMLAWLALLAVCATLLSRRDGSGTLVLAYFLGLSLIHTPGAVNFLGDAPGLIGRRETQLGFAASVLGLAALVVGALVGRDPRPPGPAPAAQPRRLEMERFGRMMLGGGLAVYFVLLPLSGVIPSAGALVGPLGGLLILGCWVLLHEAARTGDKRRRNVLLVALPILPISTMVVTGFVNFGVYWMIAVLSLAYAQSRARWAWALAAPVAVYLGLSMGVAYLTERDSFRDEVWREQVGYGQRLDSAFDMLLAFEPYDLDDPDHIVLVDLRMNQNWFVGRAILRHQAGRYDLALGGTVPLWAFVPRALWPDKPPVGGGGELVTIYAGFEVAPGVSYGAGQPMEFYANFGWAGLVGGFLILGYMLSRLGVIFARGLRDGRAWDVLRAGLPGLVLLQPGGNLLEIVVGVVGAVLASRLAYSALRRLGAAPWPQALRLDAAR